MSGSTVLCKRRKTRAGVSSSKRKGRDRKAFERTEVGDLLPLLDDILRSERSIVGESVLHTRDEQILISLSLHSKKIGR